jgi:hypothetical protein
VENDAHRCLVESIETIENVSFAMVVDFVVEYCPLLCASKRCRILILFNLSVEAVSMYLVEVKLQSRLFCTAAINFAAAAVLPTLPLGEVSIVLSNGLLDKRPFSVSDDIENVSFAMLVDFVVEYSLLRLCA